MPAHDLHLIATNLEAWIRNGRIQHLGPQPNAHARETLVAPTSIALPGLIDTHVHFNQPGRTSWEGIATGSNACAAGGITTFFDMPLNSQPVTTSAQALEQKHQRILQHSRVNAALWGGITPDTLHHIETLAHAGVIGFKAFLCDSGLPEFPHLTPATLNQAMQRVADTGRILALHAEYFPEPGLHSETPESWSATRPVERELDAVGLALEAATRCGTRLHIVHASHPRVVDMIHTARKAIDITCETCPHYLLLNDEHTAHLGPQAKCAPPLRSESARNQLIQRLHAGHIHTIGSDHSPCPPELKTGPWDQVWGGISSVQFLLPLLLSITDHTNIAHLCATAPAQRFNLHHRKGTLAEDLDADILLFDPNQTTTINPATIRYRHPNTPYLNQTFPGRVTHTILGGRLIFDGTSIDQTARGNLLTPDPNDQP